MSSRAQFGGAKRGQTKSKDPSTPAPPLLLKGVLTELACATVDSEEIPCMAGGGSRCKGLRKWVRFREPISFTQDDRLFVSRYWKRLRIRPIRDHTLPFLHRDGLARVDIR
jgi:hypothetical protein